MAEEDLRQLQRMSQAEGSLKSDAAFLRQMVREGADDAQLAELLRRTRSNVDELFKQTGLSENRQLMIKAIMMVEAQINNALRDAIQPREGDAPLPGSDEILSAVLQKITPKNAKAMLSENPEERLMKQPKLVLIPVTSADRLISALNQARQRMQGSHDILEHDDFVRDQLTDQANGAGVVGDSIKSWEFAIMEGAQTFPAPYWDDGNNTFDERYHTLLEKFHEADLEIASARAWMAGQKAALDAGKPLDCVYENDSTASDARTREWQHTLFRERQNSLVGIGICDLYTRSVCFMGDYLDSHNPRARFRTFVVGEMK